MPSSFSFSGNNFSFYLPSKMLTSWWKRCLIAKKTLFSSFTRSKRLQGWFSNSYLELVLWLVVLPENLIWLVKDAIEMKNQIENSFKNLLIVLKRISNTMSTGIIWWVIYNLGGCPRGSSFVRKTNISKTGQKRQRHP